MAKLKSLVKIIGLSLPLVLAGHSALSASKDTLVIPHGKLPVVLNESQSTQSASKGTLVIPHGKLPVVLNDGQSTQSASKDTLAIPHGKRPVVLNHGDSGIDSDVNTRATYAYHDSIHRDLRSQINQHGDHKTGSEQTLIGGNSTGKRTNLHCPKGTKPEGLSWCVLVDKTNDKTASEAGVVHQAHQKITSAEASHVNSIMQSVKK